MGLRGNCTICTDYFGVDQNISVTFCGHLFHDPCLSQWLKQCGTHRTCPQCRSKLTAKQVVPKLYINVPETGEDLDPFELQNKLDEVNSKCQKMQGDQKQTKKQLKEAEAQKEKLKSMILKLKKEVKEEKNTTDFLRNELKLAKLLEADAVDAKSEAKRLREKLSTCEKVEFLLNARKGQVDDMVKQYTLGSSIPQKVIQELATFCVSLKQEYDSATVSKTSVSSENTKLRRELGHSSQQLMKKISKIKELESTVARMRESEEQLEDENKGLKRKIGALQSAISSPSDTRSSAISRLLAESPAPLIMTPVLGGKQHTQPTKRLSSDSYIENRSPVEFKRPKLSQPDNFPDSDVGEGTSQDGSFVAEQKPVTKTKVAPDSPKTLAEKRICKEMGIPHIKVKCTLNSRTANSDFSQNPYRTSLGLHNRGILGRPLRHLPNPNRASKVKMSSKAKPFTLKPASMSTLQTKLNFLKSDVYHR